MSEDVSSETKQQKRKSSLFRKSKKASKYDSVATNGAEVVLNDYKPTKKKFSFKRKSADRDKERKIIDEKVVANEEQTPFIENDEKPSTGEPAPAENTTIKPKRRSLVERFRQSKRLEEVEPSAEKSDEQIVDIDDGGFDAEKVVHLCELKSDKFLENSNQDSKFFKDQQWFDDSDDDNDVFVDSGEYEEIDQLDGGNHQAQVLRISPIKRPPNPVPISPVHSIQTPSSAAHVWVGGNQQDSYVFADDEESVVSDRRFHEAILDDHVVDHDLEATVTLNDLTTVTNDTTMEVSKNTYKSPDYRRDEVFGDHHNDQNEDLDEEEDFRTPEAEESTSFNIQRNISEEGKSISVQRYVSDDNKSFSVQNSVENIEKTLQHMREQVNEDGSKTFPSLHKQLAPKDLASIDLPTDGRNEMIETQAKQASKTKENEAKRDVEAKVNEAKQDVETKANVDEIVSQTKRNNANELKLNTKQQAVELTCESIDLTPEKPAKTTASSEVNYVLVDKPPEEHSHDESFFAKRALKAYKKANLSKTYCQTCCSVM